MGREKGLHGRDMQPGKQYVPWHLGKSLFLLDGTETLGISKVVKVSPSRDKPMQETNIRKATLVCGHETESAC